MDKVYTCTVSCTFDIKDNFTEYKDFKGDVVGFTLPNGDIVRPIIGMEIEDKSGNYKDITHEKQFAKIGFDNMEYDTTEFTEDLFLSEELENTGYTNMPLVNLPLNLNPRFDSTRKILEERLSKGE